MELRLSTVVLGAIGSWRKDNSKPNRETWDDRRSSKREGRWRCSTRTSQSSNLLVWFAVERFATTAPTAAMMINSAGPRVVRVSGRPDGGAVAVH